MNRQNYLFFAWVIALAAFLATLYGSLIMLLPVCNLCWYQRICLYPLVIILGIGAYNDDISSATYALPLAIIAMLLALYQSLLPFYPSLEITQVCGIGVSCADTPLKLFGVITYPMMSFIASLFITSLSLLSRYTKNTYFLDS